MDPAKWTNIKYPEEGKPLRKITRNMTIGQIIEEYPEVVNVFQRYSMGCSDCPTAKRDSLEKGAMLHGMDVEALFQELNKKIK